MTDKAYTCQGRPDCPEGDECERPSEGAASSEEWIDKAADSIAHMVDEWTDRGWNEEGRAQFARLVSRRLRRFVPGANLKPDEGASHAPPNFQTRRNSMRELHGHKVNPANDKIVLSVLDEPGAGGACHVYIATLPDGSSTTISFQNGPIKEAGVNGLTHEVLLEILADRLKSFQAGPYPCRENAQALIKIQETQHWLHHRTKERMDRGVEGTHSL